NGFTDAHLEAFTAAGVGRVLIAYDNDPAGNTAAEKLAESLLGKGVECLRVVFPPGADANDLAVAADEPALELGKALRSARWIGRGARSTQVAVARILAGPSDPVAGMLAELVDDRSVPSSVRVPDGPGSSVEACADPVSDPLPVLPVTSPGEGVP